MDQREQTNQPNQPEAEVVSEQAQRPAQEGPAIRAESIATVRSMLDHIEAALDESPRALFRNNLSMVNSGELRNYASTLRSELNNAMLEAVEVLANKQQIEFTARQRAQEKTNQAETKARNTIEHADAYAKQTIESAQQRAAEIEQQARATAEKILMQANAEAQMRTEESEIVRRANARAGEIYDQVQLDVDGMYKTAQTEVNKMLSGAAAALNRSAMELASLRDQLINPNGDPGARA